MDKISKTCATVQISFILLLDYTAKKTIPKHFIGKYVPEFAKGFHFSGDNYYIHPRTFATQFQNYLTKMRFRLLLK